MFNDFILHNHSTNGLYSTTIRLIRFKTRFFDSKIVILHDNSANLKVIFWPPLTF